MERNCIPKGCLKPDSTKQDASTSASVLREEVPSLDGIAISLPSDLLKSGFSLNDCVYLRNIKKRELWLCQEICGEAAVELTRLIYKYNVEDFGKTQSQRKPIKLFVSSPGGSATAGMAIIDAIKISKTPVWTINIGIAYSMALHIMTAGHVRYALPSSTFLLHDGSEGGFDSSNKFRDLLHFTDEIDRRLREHLLEHTKIPEDTYQANLRKEWYMFPEEAEKLGIIDKVVTDFEQILSSQDMLKFS